MTLKEILLQGDSAVAKTHTIVVGNESSSTGIIGPEIYYGFSDGQVTQTSFGDLNPKILYQTAVCGLFTDVLNTGAAITSLAVGAEVFKEAA